MTGTAATAAIDLTSDNTRRRVIRITEVDDGYDPRRHQPVLVWWPGMRGPGFYAAMEVVEEEREA